MIDTALDVERQEVLHRTEDEVKAIEACDLDRYLSLLSQDAVFMPQNQTIKTGDELKPWLLAFLDRVSVRYTRFDHGETTVRDDLAIHTYTCAWTATPKPAGEPRSAAFKGMHVLRRGPDGKWRIAVHIWNTDPEPLQQ